MITSIEAPINVMITLQPMNIVQAAADVLWSRVLQKFPDLRIALSEGGIGWIPYFLERGDYVYKNHKPWTGQDLGMLPSELFRERIITCFIDDAAGSRPCAPQHRHDHVGVRLPPLRLDVARVARAAAARRWSACPTTRSTRSPTATPCGSSSTTRSRCGPARSARVGALRAEAAGVDVSIKSAGLKFEPPTEPIRIMDLAERTKTKRS